MLNTNLIKIDAKGKSIGRIATQVAVALRGKSKPNFRPHLLPDVSVEVTNAKEMKISPTKKTLKTYKTYTGYPGGLKEKTLEMLIEKKGYAEPLRLAVLGMLPGNKLRAKLIKRLTIHD